MQHASTRFLSTSREEVLEQSVRDEAEILAMPLPEETVNAYADLAIKLAQAPAPTASERYNDMLRYIDREVTRKVWHNMTTGLNFVAAIGNNQHTLVVTMPATAQVWWDRLAPLVQRAENYAGFDHAIVNPSAAQCAELSLDGGNI